MRRVARTLIGAAGLSAALGLFGVPATPAAAEVDITAGDHCRTMAEPVEDLYRAFFLREPDEAGLDFWTRWVTGLDGGINEAAEHFARSPEFIDRYGELSDEEFVVQLYANILDREPDAEGLEYWTWALGTGFYTRGAAVTAWTLAPEFHGVATSSEIPFRELRYAVPGMETWCGVGPAQIRVERMPLTVGQGIGVRRWVGPDADLDLRPTESQVSGRADGGTVVVSAIGSLYVHPNLAASILYYQIDIWNDTVLDADGPEQAEPLAWVASTEGIGPPWNTWPPAE